MPVGKLQEKTVKFLFSILKINEERSGIRTKMSRIPNTAAVSFLTILYFVRLSSWRFWKLRSPVCGEEADGASIQPRDTSPAGDHEEQDQATVIKIMVCSSIPLFEVEGHAKVNFSTATYAFLLKSPKIREKNCNLGQHKKSVSTYYKMSSWQDKNLQ